MASQQQQPHVLVVPLPLQGPLNCFLNLTTLLLSHSTISVTFLTPSFVLRRLSSLPLRHPNLRLSVLDDGISGDSPRPAELFPAMVSAVEAHALRLLPDTATPLTCVIADGVFTGLGQAARGLGVPVVYFSTLSPCCLWLSCSLVPRLVDSARVPFRQGDDMDEPMTDVPGTETFLRRRDLPGICRAQDMSDPYIQLVLRECRELPNAQGHILNTFDDLEEPVLTELRSLCPNLYNIGPIHLHWKTRLQLQTKEQATSSNSLWKEDRSCIAWLDAQPSKSVIFVSYGSIVVLTVDQLMEFWYGLVNSGVRFLWVRRPGSIQGLQEDGDDSQLQVPPELLDGTKKRGFIVSWTPQAEVLAHRAIGGFLTHSGWNSTLESIVEGVPMLCWPCGIDQLVISRFVGEVWKIGIDMKDTCDRVAIENMVRDLMQRRDEFSQKSSLLSKLAGQAVEKGGSSWCDLDRLIEDIKFMRLQVVPDTS